jgi:beta-galactosidase
VTTPQLTDDQATVAVKTEVHNRSANEVKIRLRTSIQDSEGKAVTSRDVSAAVAGDGTQSVPVTLTVSHPQQWDIEHPNLYTLVSEVIVNGQSVDRYTTPFGIRTIAFDKERGFLLNGKHVRLHGVCNHHDLGALGTAVNRRATERQLQILKAAGVNAIRTSHNPPSPELLEFADRLGFLVMDEAFDMWRIPKKPNGYSKYFDQWSERDVRDMARRDRNHPVEHWQRDSRAGGSEWGAGSPPADRLLSRGGSYAADHFGV